MPDEYISREAAVKAANEWVSEACMAPVMRVSRLFDKLQKVPAADVAEVVHARWKRVRSNWYCTGCNKGYRITKGAPMASSFSYCPNCGAKMDGGNDDATD